MNNLSIASIIEKNKLASNTPFLPCLDIQVIDPATNLPVEMIYLVRNNEDITWNGHDYVATPFEMSIQTSGTGYPNVTLTIWDYSGAIQARMQAYGGGVLSKVTISVVNAGDLANPAPEVQEYFQVVNAQAANYQVQWTLGAENPLTLAFPLGTQMKNYCRWTYKGQECQYAGPLANCDLTLKGPNGCQAHNNVINYGGLPGINATGMQYG